MFNRELYNLQVVGFIKCSPLKNQTVHHYLPITSLSAIQDGKKERKKKASHKTVLLCYTQMFGKLYNLQVVGFIRCFPLSTTDSILYLPITSLSAFLFMLSFFLREGGGVFTNYELKFM